MKLALFALVLGLGAGACVAEDPSSGRIDTSAVGDIRVADQAEIPSYDTDETNLAIVTITGVEIAGRATTSDVPSFANITEALKDPQTRQLCAVSDTLPGSNICSTLCNPAGFSARLFDNGSPGGCKQLTCAMPGDTVVTFELCTTN